MRDGGGVVRVSGGSGAGRVGEGGRAVQWCSGILVKKNSSGHPCH